MTRVCLQGGEVYDPSNDVAGDIRDVWFDDGRIIAPPPEDERAGTRYFDVRDMIVMPGGVDMHCHIAGPKVNTARKMMPEQKRRARPVMRTANTRSGTTGSVPSTFATGYLYAGLGYTSAFDAAVPPLTARHAHEELQDTPVIDKGFYVMMGNNHFVMKQIEAGDHKMLDAYVAWLLNAAGGYAAKLVNPGGVEVWKCGGGDVSGIDSAVDRFHISPRQIITEMARSVDRLGLPHPVHIHCNNLGMPGNFATTLETMKSLEGSRGHVTHIQFHSYGGDADDQATFCSEVPGLAEYVNSHPELTVDVGQVMFSETTSMTGDGPLGYFLHKVTGRKWFSGDTEMEAGCGIVPIRYRNKSLVHALQWAIGLEWYLLVDDPWRIAMSTDHPNGGSFLAYPEIIALLMDRTRREAVLESVPEEVRNRCVLADLTREYTLNEIAIITRAGPARMLGLTHKGHLGVGADADITVYSRQADLQQMFQIPRYVFSRGHLAVEDGEVREDRYGRTHCVRPAYDEEAVPAIQNWFEQYYTIQFRNYPIESHDLGDHLDVVPSN
jgi:formylmethanofuran dehydrogenase subunit A